MQARAGSRTEAFLSGGGEMGALLRAADWSMSPLGPPETWPQSLRTLVQLVLNSKFPMFLGWGPDLTFLYNDAFVPLADARHPEGLGRPLAEVWSEIWGDIRPMVETALSGRAVFQEDMPLQLTRSGYREEASFTFSYSPVHDEAGKVQGLFCVLTETTAEVRARRAVREEREHLEDLFRQAPGFMCVLREPSHRFELVNDAFQKLVGARDMIGRSIREAMPDLEGQGFLELLDEVYRSGRAHVGRSFLVTIEPPPPRSRITGYIDFVLQPIRSASGDVTGIFIEGTDVTERQQAEVALRQSEQRLRLAVEAGRMAVWDFDVATETLTGDSDLNRLLGFPADHKLTIAEARSRYFPGEQDRIRKEAAECLARGERFVQSEYRYVWPDGSVRWHLLRAEVLFLPDGSPKQFVGIVIDITERREAEEALRQREQDLTTALGAAAMGTYVFDHVGRHFQSSPRLNEIYGYPPEQPLTLEDLRARYHPQDVDHIEDLFRASQDPSCLHFEMEFRLLLPDGTVTWVNGTGEYRRDAAGRVLSSRGIVRDVSERKRAEERQKLLVDELNHRVKNSLATVQALASQSFRAGEDAGPAKNVFAARLIALAEAHDVLTRESWEGADFAAIVAGAMRPFRGEGADCVTAEGPQVRLNSKEALAFALGLHELATNAAKYGALSDPAGRVAIEWRIGERPGGRRHFGVVWRESGGPPVSAPRRKGFGSRLLHRGLAAELDGEVQVTYDPGGVIWRFDCEI